MIISGKPCKESNASEHFQKGRQIRCSDLGGHTGLILGYLEIFCVIGAFSKSLIFFMVSRAYL